MPWIWTLTAILITSVIGLITRILRKRKSSAQITNNDTAICCVYHAPEPPPQTRFRFSNAFRSCPIFIHGYPTKGGIYTLPDPLGVDFDFLGLDRFATLRSGLGMFGSLAENPRISHSEEEDEFCDKLRQLGAQWIKDWSNYPEQSKLFRKNIIQIGWPSKGGGVWALHIMRSFSKQKPVALINNARNMDEKCEIIRLLGGKFYADPEKCLWLRNWSDMDFDE